MKMKFCSVLTAVIFMLSRGMTVSAAAMPNPAADLNAQNGNARSTQSFSRWGDSYTITYEGVQCRCEISNNVNVTAGTDKSNSTVTISSKSYNSSTPTVTNGSNGGAAANTVTVTYRATSLIICAYQEHGAPYNTTVTVTLLRN